MNLDAERLSNSRAVLDTGRGIYLFLNIKPSSIQSDWMMRNDLMEGVSVWFGVGPMKHKSRHQLKVKDADPELSVLASDSPHTGI